MSKSVRTSEGLRNLLFDELDALRAGKSTPQKASAVAKLAGEICGTIRMEIDYFRITGGRKTRDPLDNGRVLKLGNG
jgi:hypothetical protein